jgi:cyanophycinase-like exopeptidase
LQRLKASGLGEASIKALFMMTDIDVNTARKHRPATTKADQSLEDSNVSVSAGHVRVMSIDGGKQTRGEETILQRFVDLADGMRARIVVTPTASEQRDKMGQQCVKVFDKLGAKSVKVLDIRVRNDANPS